MLLDLVGAEFSYGTPLVDVIARVLQVKLRPELAVQTSYETELMFAYGNECERELLNDRWPSLVMATHLFTPEELGITATTHEMIAGTTMLPNSEQQSLQVTASGSVTARLDAMVWRRSRGFQPFEVKSPYRATLDKFPRPGHVIQVILQGAAVAPQKCPDGFVVVYDKPEEMLYFHHVGPKDAELWPTEWNRFERTADEFYNHLIANLGDLLKILHEETDRRRAGAKLRQVMTPQRLGYLRGAVRGLYNEVLISRNLHEVPLLLADRSLLGLVDGQGGGE